ncbi:hypothetical protein GEMRC1_002756 [Eukaryota sp. GEM-RC1]
MLTQEKLLRDKSKLKKALEKASLTHDFHSLFTIFQSLSNQILGIGQQPHVPPFSFYSKGYLYKAADLLSNNSDFRCSIPMSMIPPFLLPLLSAPATSTSDRSNGPLIQLIMSKAQQNLHTLSFTPLDFLAFAIPLLIARPRSSMSSSRCKIFSKLCQSWLNFSETDDGLPTSLFYHLFLFISLEKSIINDKSSRVLSHSSLCFIFNAFQKKSKQIEILKRSMKFLALQRRLLTISNQSRV